jgi:hypothetical protein
MLTNRQQQWSKSGRQHSYCANLTTNSLPAANGNIEGRMHSFDAPKIPPG